MTIAYEGKHPYIFISYSHQDTDFVMRVIEYLQANGFATWFDGGIEAGSEWPEYIASHLRNCACMLSFISTNFVESDNCRRELNFAQDIKKPILNVYIADTELTDGMRMQLGLNQAIYRSKHPSDDRFFDAIAKARIIQPCRLPQPEPESPAPVVTPAPVVSAAPVVNVAPTATQTPSAPQTEAAKPQPEPQTRKTTQLNKKSPSTLPLRLYLLFVLLELSYIFLGTHATNQCTALGLSWWALTLLMIVPHTALLLLQLLLLFTLGKPLSGDEKSTALTTSLMAFVPAVIIEIIVSSTKVHCVSNVFLRFFVSIGLNICPALIMLISIFILVGTMTSSD